jgi:hypothetical protein
MKHSIEVNNILKRVDQPGKGRVSLWFFSDDGASSQSFLNYPTIGA